MRVTFSNLSRTIELCEDSTYQPKALKVDRTDPTAPVIREAKLLGAKSSNGNDYTDGALREFAELYRGRISYVDHAPKGATGRSVLEAWAWVVEGSERIAVRPGDGVYGDVRVNPKHPIAEQVLYFAEHKPDALGFSHDAQGRGRAQPNGRYLVEGAASVASVDLVWKGATTRGLFEGATVKPTGMTAKTLAEALLADRMAKGKLGAVFTTAMELVQAHLDDAGIDDAERMKRVMGVVDELHAEIKTMAGGKPDEKKPAEGDAPAPPKEEAVAESAELKKMREEHDARLKKIEEGQVAEAIARRRASREQMLREAGLPASGQLLETITAELDDAKAKALVEQVRPTAGRGPRSVQQTTEGAGGIPTGDALKNLGKSLGFKGR